VQDPFTPREPDLALVETLQVAPRAPWSAVARTLGTSPVTAARRWQRLADAGLAWVTGAPGVRTWDAQCLAYAAVSCRPGRKLDVAETLAADPQALTVELTAGAADLLVTVAAGDLAALSRYLLERLDRVPGVTATHTRIATRLFTEGSGWRLGVLGPEEVAALPRPPVPSRGAAGPPVSGPADRALLTALARNGRASYAELAAAAGVSPATARRRVERLLASGTVLLRTEVSAPLVGWPVSVVFSADAPAGRLDALAAAVGRIRQVRLCATLAGAPSLIIIAWLHTVEEVHRFELALLDAVPGLVVVDRLVVLRSLKRMGRLLDESGRAVGVVPLAPWAA
jgi:DNA-binding Lrp family transcriptional regulator